MRRHDPTGSGTSRLEASPPPLAGEGQGGGRRYDFVRSCPSPTPPPQAGEGAHRMSLHYRSPLVKSGVVMSGAMSEMTIKSARSRAARARRRGERAGALSDAADPAGRRLRRRRADRYSGALRRRQARRRARPARRRGEQAGRLRHGRDPRRALAAARRLHPAALHAFRSDQHRRLQERAVQAQRSRADLAHRQILLRRRAGEHDSGRRRSRPSCNTPRRIAAR